MKIFLQAIQRSNRFSEPSTVISNDHTYDLYAICVRFSNDSSLAIVRYEYIPGVVYVRASYVSLHTVDNVYKAYDAHLWVFAIGDPFAIMRTRVINLHFIVQREVRRKNV